MGLVVFKHFRVSIATCVINFYLKHSFYIDISKNISKNISCKKMRHLSFLIHFGKRIEDKWWMGVELGSCDRKTVVFKGVNLS